MELKTNVTLLIPSRKVYCDFEINLDRVPITGNPRTDGDYAGTWNEITYKPTPVREGYAKFNFFADLAGDAYLDKHPIECKMFFWRFGTRTTPKPQSLARIDMNVIQHFFPVGQESWAKKAELIPSMEEIFAIYWN